MRTLLEPEYTVLPALRSLDRNAFIPDRLSYQDEHQQLALLMIAYARSLQYLGRKTKSDKKPESPSFGRKCHQIMGDSETICYL